LSVALLGIALLTACGGSGSSTSNSTMNLNVTDSPVDNASSVVIQVTGVELKPSGGGNSVTVTFSSPMQIDLLTLQNGRTASLLTGASLPAGKYDWMRLMVSTGSDNAVAGSFVEVNGAQFPLIIPSGEQNGLKLVHGFTLTANQTGSFTIDFVVRQSITAPAGQQVGGVQAYVLSPVLHLISNGQAGEISGTVALATLQGLSPSCFDSNGNSAAHVYIFSGAGATLTDIQVDPMTGLVPAGHVNPVVTPPVTQSSGQYTYTQSFLPAGTYTVALACGTDDPATADKLTFSAPAMATVTAGQTSTVNF